MTYACEGSCEELIIDSAYLPYDSYKPPPTKELRDVIDYCCSRKKQLIIGCDANAHYILWGSTGTNARGEGFMEYLVSLNLNIPSQGNEPTFVVQNRKEVLHKLYLHPQCNLFIFSSSFSLSQYVSPVYGHVITTSIYRELHTHKHPCRCKSNQIKGTLYNDVWIKRQQPPSKILKSFN
jgi:hypothetical protein